MADDRHTLIKTASYEAEPGEVGRVLLLYSGGLDTSVMLKWIQDEYEAEVVALTVNLGQPGEDYDVVKGKALQLGALDCHVVDAREDFAREYVAPADREAGGGVRAEERLRHDRARLHREGQRPGPNRVQRDRTRPQHEDHRAGSRLADGARGGDRLCAGARHPGEGRHRDAALLDRRQPVGTLVRGRADRGPRGAAARRRLPARDAPGGGAGRVRGRGRGLRARCAGLPERRAARAGGAARAGR